MKEQQADSSVRMVEGAPWKELVDLLGAALAEGKRRGLLRFAAQQGLEEDEVRRELAAFPGGACAAVDPLFGISVGRCLAGSGCPVLDECPLVTSDPAQMRRSAIGSLVCRAVECWVPEEFPECPLLTLGAFRAPLERMLARCGLDIREGPPRARASLALVDLAVGRGGPPGVEGGFLSAEEAEQLAAFLPPGSGRGDPALAPVEAWLRRVATEEGAIVQLGPLPRREQR